MLNHGMPKPNVSGSSWIKTRSSTSRARSTRKKSCCRIYRWHVNAQKTRTHASSNKRMARPQRCTTQLPSKIESTSVSKRCGPSSSRSSMICMSMPKRQIKTLPPKPKFNDNYLYNNKLNQIHWSLKRGPFLLRGLDSSLKTLNDLKALLAIAGLGCATCWLFELSKLKQLFISIWSSNVLFASCGSSRQISGG